MSEELTQEKCGIVGLFSKEYTSQLNLTLQATVGVQHRGTHGAGTVFKTKKGLVKYYGNGLLREVFTLAQIKKLQQPSRWLIMHSRYGTNGGYGKENLQPCVFKSKGGEEVAVAHNGEFVNMHSFASKLPVKMAKNVSDTYIFSLLLAMAKGKNWNEKLLATLDAVKGSYGLIVGIGETLYAARDPHGIRPLCIGTLKDHWLIASETHAFDKVGAKVIREIKRGEVVRINKDGMEVIRRGNKAKKHFCDFEWAYFSRPDSFLPPNGEGDIPLKWLSFGHFRERCGQELAREAPIRNATFVVGVPDSGLSMTIGYANAIGIPYRQVIVRDHYDPDGDQRLFMRDDQIKRIRKKVLGKLSLIPESAIWKNAVVVIGDDSIVRGNVSAQITKAIFAMGAREVHWIVGFPPVMRPCHLGVSIRTPDELIAARHGGDVKKITKEIGATSIRYISPAGFIRARLKSRRMNYPKNPLELFLRNGGCGGCVTGLYPIDKQGNEYDSKRIAL